MPKLCFGQDLSLETVALIPLISIIVIVFDSLPKAYREAFVYDKWPIDAFIHDLDTLRYFFEESRSGNSISGLMDMMISGKEFLDQNNVSIAVKKLAEEYKAIGPVELSKERFLITDILDDVKFPKNKDEQIMSAIHLFEPLIQFYFRGQKKWSASGKSLIRLLKSNNPELALEWPESCESFFKQSNTANIESFVEKILQPYGELLWDGFRSDVSSD